MRRWLVLGILWLASALLAGWLVAPWIPVDDLPQTAPSDAPGGAESRPAPVAGPTPLRVTSAGDGAGHDPDVGAVKALPRLDGAAPVAEPPDGTLDFAASMATLQVRVRRADGTLPAHGYVYLLPAGAPGLETDSAIFHGNLTDGELEFRVPDGCLVDVFCWAETNEVRALDVRVGPGTTAVTLALPPGAPVTVSYPEELPPIDGAKPEVWVSVAQPDAAPDGPKPPKFGGRSNPAAEAGASAVALPGEDAQTAPLPVGIRCDVQVHVLYKRKGQRVRPLAKWGLIPEPRTVEAGGRIRLRRVRLGRIETTLLVSGTPPPGKDRAIVYARHEATGATVLLTHARGVAPTAPATVTALPGDYVVRTTVSGRPWREGQRFAVAAGVPARLTVSVEFDAGLADPPPAAAADLRGDQSSTLDIPVHCEGPFATRFREEGAQVLLAGGGWSRGRYAQMHRVGEGDWTQLPRVFRVDPTTWAGGLTAVAISGGRWASDPFPLGGGGTLTLRLRPAGLLTVVPGALGNTSAPLEVERLNGGPIPHPGGRAAGTNGSNIADHLSFEASKRVAVTLGTILGPFPEGPVSLRVFQGGLPLGIVRGHAVSGQIRALTLAR